MYARSTNVLTQYSMASIYVRKL